MPLDKSWCYFIPCTQDPTTHGGYVPSMVFRDKPGHAPLTGRGEGSLPWVWGSTLDEARSICTEQNARIGITERDECEIVMSSFAQQNREDGNGDPE